MFKRFQNNKHITKIQTVSATITLGVHLGEVEKDYLVCERATSTSEIEEGEKSGSTLRR